MLVCVALYVYLFIGNVKMHILRIHVFFHEKTVYSYTSWLFKYVGVLLKLNKQ